MFPPLAPSLPTYAIACTPTWLTHPRPPDDLTVGPVCYSLVAVIPSTRLRQKSIVLARNFYNFWGIMNNVWTPYMLTPEAWNWGAKTGFWWAGWAILCLTWAFFRLPEPKGRTYGELDVLFERRVSARQFHKTDVDLLAAGHETAQAAAGGGGGESGPVRLRLRG